MKTALPLKPGNFILGIDLGTSACKVSLVDGQGELAGEAREGYETHSPQPGWLEQNPADWLKSVEATVRRLWKETALTPDSVAGIALTSAAHIGVLLDNDGLPVRPAILWNDQRSVAEVADLEKQAGDEILEITCQAVSTGWTLPHLLWVQRHDPSAWKRIHSIMLSKDFLLKWMTGETVTDPATAVSSQLYDVRTSRWSSRLCDLAGVKPDMLPNVLPAGNQTGGLTADAATALGLRTGTPVINGTLDSATELLAAGICTPGESLIRLATAGGIQRVAKAPSPDRHCITYPHAIPPFWYCQAGTNTCAAAVQWGRKLFSGQETPSYETWDTEAANVPAGAEGLLFHPYLAGERAPLWDPALRASFTGLALSHGRGHMARAIYEGTAFSIRHALTVLPQTSRDTTPLAVVGGGAKSILWVTILAHVLGQPLRIAEGADSSCGAALIALTSLGLVDDLQTLSTTRARTGIVIHPSAAKQDFYAHRFEAWTQGRPGK